MTKTKWCVIQKTNTKSEFAVKINTASTCLQTVCVRTCVRVCVRVCISVPGSLSGRLMFPYSSEKCTLSLVGHSRPLLVRMGTASSE